MGLAGPCRQPRPALPAQLKACRPLAATLRLCHQPLQISLRSCGHGDGDLGLLPMLPRQPHGPHAAPGAISLSLPQAQGELQALPPQPEQKACF